MQLHSVSRTQALGVCQRTDGRYLSIGLWGHSRILLVGSLARNSATNAADLPAGAS